jgi:peptidoglycan/xylan/chitin deacetylase (PgdA/CDA1 family)
MTILCYHSVEPGWTSPLAVAPEAFAEHCAWLERRGVVELSEVTERLDRTGRLPRDLVALTFDDGFAALYDHAFPLLKRHRLPATVFLVAETLTPEGREVDWVDTPPPYPMRTLTRDQVLEMAEAGIRFGSHSFSHYDLASLSAESCLEDLRRSRELLEDLLKRPVPFLAYPRGRHNHQVHEASRKAGFTHAFTLPEEPEELGPFAVPRAGVYPGNSPNALRLKSSPWYLSLRTSRVFPALRKVVKGERPPTRLPG